METGNSINRSNLMRRYIAIIPCAYIGLISGCGTVELPSQPDEPRVHPLDEWSDLGAIAKVVEHVYGRFGGGAPVIFLATGDTCDSVFPTCSPQNGGISPILKAHLESRLHVKVRPLSEAEYAEYSGPSIPPPSFTAVSTPLDPDTGEAGVAVTLGAFTEIEEGRQRVNVFVSHSGVNCVGFDVDLEPAENGWAIVFDEPTPDNPPKPYLLCRLRPIGIVGPPDGPGD